MTQIELDNIWNYYLSLERDFSNTSRYIEPSNQEDVYSYEFFKLLILSCTEIESLLKIFCVETNGSQCGNIGEYKEIVLSHYPKIVSAEVYVPRWAKMILPFSGWDTGRLEWWDSYVNVKHNRGNNFRSATYKNAVYALSALYLLILYLAKTNNIRVDDADSTYIISDYSFRYYVCSPNKLLPDFDLDNSISTSEKIETTAKVFCQSEEPTDSHNGDIWIAKK